MSGDCTRRPCLRPWLTLLVLAFVVACGQGAVSSSDLLTFAKALHNTPSGQGWTSTTSQPACDWTGITCQAAAANGFQTFAVDLSQQVLGGNISATWATLPSFAQGLVSLNLSGNLMGGSLPSNWTNLTALQTLDLSDNMITGPLPVQWSDWAAPLNNVTLSANNLTGALPAAWGTAGLASLTTLDLSDNQLTSSIPATWTGFAGGLAALGSLKVANNSLAGSLPAVWTARPPRFTLNKLELSPGNGQLCAVNGTLPAAFRGVVNSTGGAPGLQDCGNSTWGYPLLNFSASFSNFQEATASYFGWTPDLVDIPCSWGGVSCDISATGEYLNWGGPFLSSPLLDLDLADLNLIGSIDKSWDALPELFSLQLDNSAISGQLPDSWAQSWPKLEWLSMPNTSLVSTLPNAWGQDPGNGSGWYKNLAQIWFDKNPGLHGTLPSSYTSLTAMLVFSLPSCNISGTLPAGYGNSSTVFANLQQMDVTGNRLTGTFPPWGINEGMQSMEYLDFSDNPGLQGALPASMSRMSNLQAVQADGTQVCGSVRTAGNTSNSIDPATFTGAASCPPTAPPPAPLPAPAPTYPVTAAQPPAAPPPKGSGTSGGTIAGAVVGALAALAIAAVAAFYVIRRRSRTRSQGRDLAARNLQAQGGKDLDMPLTALMPPGQSYSSDNTTLAGASSQTDSGKGSGSTFTPRTPSFAASRRWEITPDRINIARNADGTLAKLGSGAFGDVYRGILDGTLQVAIKMLRQDGLDGSARKALVNEIRVLHEARSPNVVLFLGAYLGDQQLYMVQELMAQDLSSALEDPEQQEQLSWLNRGHVVAMDIALGVAYLHQASIVHLDIKSGNVLLSREGKAKIADAGLAVAMMNETHRSQMSIRGTFPYMAPEVLMGTAVNKQSDIYSCGVVFWEICSGGEKPIRGRMRDLSTDDCPREVIALIDACLAPSPDDRPTAKELVHALDGLAGLYSAPSR